MRLKTEDIKIIKTLTATFFGETSSVFLFGSRVDDHKKGGDIDLYIEVDDKHDLFERKIKFLARLKRAIGDQKIDLVFNEDSSRLIEQEIKKWAIKL
ncbi:MAG: nucleotidyltransferase domain-containing protein [Methylococcales bacterium]|nr:nucleotidyltransferase domain-containing protein [Methylococcales bacterium]